MNKQLKTIDEHNTLIMRIHNGVEDALNGIACPLCGEECCETRSSFRLLTSPPQKLIKCSKCVWTGYVFSIN